MSGFTLFETILSVVLTAIVSPIIKSHYLDSSSNFRKEMVETTSYLELHSNILLNSFKMPQDDDFIDKVEVVQSNIRVKWSVLKTAYFINISKHFRFILTTLKRIPKKEEMEKVLSELIGLSNSIIIYKEEHAEIALTDLEDRKKSIEKVMEIITKYI